MKEAIVKLTERRDGIKRHLADEAAFTFADQKHLDANTPERAYWHHGYMSALADALILIEEGK